MKPPRLPDGYTHDALRQHLEKVNKVLNGLSFGRMVPDPANPGKVKVTNGSADQNIQCWKATGTAPGSANTDFTINHSLGYIPTTIVGQDTTNGGVLYRSPATAWTATSVTLRCTAASSVYVVILS